MGQSVVNIVCTSVTRLGEILKVFGYFLIVYVIFS